MGIVSSLNIGNKNSWKEGQQCWLPNGEWLSNEWKKKKRKGFTPSSVLFFGFVNRLDQVNRQTEVLYNTIKAIEQTTINKARSPISI